MIHKKWILSCCACLFLAGSCILAGCNESSTKDAAVIMTPMPTATAEPTAAPTPEPTPEIETKHITVKVLNLSSTDVGMFSIIDPVQQAQTDFNPLAANGTLSFECDWPLTIKEFQWAAYDAEGNLLLESTTDITDCKESLSILLSGEETIDDVDVLLN